MVRTSLLGAVLLHAASALHVSKLQRRHILKGCGLAIFSLLVFDCHFAWFFASKDRRKRPWLRVLAFLVDLAAVAVVVIVAVEWAVGWLMSWNLSAKSHPFEWTDFSIAPKRPADYDDYYAYDYAGDYGG